MKNLFTLLVFSLLTFISCQAEPKNTSSDKKVPKATASVPVATPTAAPAAVAVSDTDMMKKDGMSDEAPAVPEEAAMAAKSVKNMDAKEMIAKRAADLDKMKEKMTDTDKMMDKKPDIDSQIAAEKEKLAAAQAKATAEAKDMAAKKAAEANEMASKKAAEAKAMAAKKAAEVKAMADAKTNIVKNTVVEKTENVKEVVAFSHQAFDDLLRKHVSSAGKVNYAGFKQDQAKLTAYIKQLEGQPVESGWSKNKKLAFWINTYNANTISLILNNYPIKSITDLEGGKPWDKKFVKADGKTLTLNNIENDIIRPTFKDARIHFAVNCAAKSCPPLMNKAWTESNLQSELEKRAKSFINNSKYNTISSGSATISKIFEWYAVDFGSLNDYLAKYSEVNSSTQISYNEYDWSLNN